MFVFIFYFSTTVANLQQKLEMCNTTNALMKEDLAIAKNTILELEDEKLSAESQRDTILHVHKHHIEVCPKCGFKLEPDNNNSKSNT
jgi:rubrerythrin